MYEPRIGQFGVIRSSGAFARLIQVGTLSRWNHAFIYVGNGLIVEAKPRGVVVSPVTDYSLIAWNKHEVFTDTQGKVIASYALGQVGKPYNFLIIAILTLRILGLKALSNNRLLHKLAQKDGYICSELVAEAYAWGGIPISKGTPELCTPGNLAERLVYA